MKTKVCVKCKIQKSHKEFKLAKVNNDGLYSYCKPCEREYARVYQFFWAKRRKTKVDSLMQKPCLDCNKRFPPECMDFDHVRSKKSFHIGRLRNGRSWKAILAEVKKCDVVCANCHRIRTQERLQKMRYPF